MIYQFIGLFVFIITTIALVVLYYFKVFWHLKLIIAQDKKKKNKPVLQPLDLLIFEWKDSSQRKLRLEALWMYPLLFPVEIEETDAGEILEIKKMIKRWNIALYLALIALFLSYIYISKAGIAD